MALLVGTDGAGWTTDDTSSPQSSSGDAFWHEPEPTEGWVAVASGTATLAYFHPTDWVTASNLKIVVYNASRVKLAESAVMSSSGGTGLKSVSINVSITSGLTYFLVVVPQSGYVNCRQQASTTFQSSRLAMNYATPDDPLPAQSLGNTLKFLIYLDGSSGGGTSTVTLNDSITPSDAVIRSAIRGNVFSDSLTVADAFSLWWYRNRIAESAIVVTEGATQVYTTTNMDAMDGLSMADGLVAFFRRNRLAEDAISITDELIATTIGYLIFVSVLTSNATVTDQALSITHFSRLMESDLLTDDQMLRACFVARSLLDSVDVTDQNLTALQRFILLTDAISMDDSLSSLLVSAVTSSPIILIGFDQPRIEIGGYGL